MARRVATFYRRDGWFRLVPPGGNGGAEYWFRELDDLLPFAGACGWMLREGR